MTENSVLDSRAHRSAPPVLAQGHRPAFRLALLRPRHWLSWALFAAAATCGLLPGTLRGWLGDRLARLFVTVDSARKQRIMTNLALCYPALSDQQRNELAYENARVAAHMILGYGRLMFMSRRALRSAFDVSGIEHVERIAANGSNVVLLTPHCMALEHAGLRLNLDRTIMTMIRAHNNPAADWVVTRVRTRLGAVLFRHDASLISLIRTMRRGIWFYYLPDEDEGQAGTVFADFFHVPKATVPVLGRLARAADAAVVPMRSAYDPATRRFSIHFHAPIEGLDGDDPTGDARRMNAALERMIDADPSQYLWTQKIFRTRPPGSPNVY
jgi:lipid A biosynthesis (KDO)2-(lauroyl)-lipid IVA acyltransferase